MNCSSSQDSESRGITTKSAALPRSQRPVWSAPTPGMPHGIFALHKERFGEVCVRSQPVAVL